MKIQTRNVKLPFIKYFLSFNLQLIASCHFRKKDY